MRVLARQERAEKGRARDTDAVESSSEAAHSPLSDSAPRKAHLREEGMSEHAETNEELGEVEGDAGRRRGAGNKAEEARGAPMAGGGAVRAELRRESEREREREGAHGVEARMASALALSTGGGGGRGVRGPRNPSTRRRWPDTVGRARRGRVRARRRRRTRARGGRAGFAGWAGWLAPARQ